MSGALPSAFPDQNILFNAASGLTTSQVQRNQLLNQETQQTLGGNEIEMIGRAAGTLMDKTLYPTPEARAAAYPVLVGALQRQGFAKNAPATYPGDDQMAGLARLGTPSADLYKLGQAGTAIPTPGFNTGAAAPAAGGGAAPAVPATSGTVEPDALARAQQVRDGLIQRGLDTDTATAFAANALHESSANPNTGAGDAGASHGLFQWRDDRYNRYQSIFGNTPDKAPLGQQLDYVVHELNTTEGAARDRIAAAQGPAAKAAAISQYYLRPKDVQPEMARRSGTATQLVSQWGNAGTSSPQAPVIAGDSLASSGGLGGSGVVGAGSKAVLAAVQADSRAGKYSGQPVVLSTGASNDGPTPDFASIEQQIRETQAGNAGRITVLGVGPAVEAKAPGTNAKLEALAKSYGADFVPLPANMMSPDGVHPNAQGYAALKAAVAPPAAAPGGVAARTGGTDVAGPGAGSGTAAAPQAPLPPDQAKARAASTGQPVPVAGVQGLWALPDGTVTQTPPAATPASAQQPPAAPATAPAQVAPVAVPAPPEMDQSNLTRQDYQDLDRARRSGMTGPQLTQEVQQRQVANLARQEKYRADVRQAQNDAQAATEKAKADAIAAENLRLSQEGGQRDTERLRLAQITSQREQDAAAREAQRLAIEQKKAEQGSTQADRDSYTLRTEDPSSQQYVDAWSRKKWTVAPNGNVIENDVSQYPAPTRSIQRPSFLPAPTPQGLDEVRKADTDGKVITSAIDHYLDVYKATGGGGWDAYFANPQNPKTQQLLGAFDRMKTVLRSPVYYNTGVLQPAEISMMGQDLVSPQTLRGAFASPEALATRLGEIKLAILTRQDAELRSVGKDGVIVRDKADYNKIPDGGQYYDEEGHLKIKTGKQ